MYAIFDGVGAPLLTAGEENDDRTAVSTDLPAFGLNESAARFVHGISTPLAV
jgi:hypothetical protein